MGSPQEPALWLRLSEAQASLVNAVASVFRGRSLSARLLAVVLAVVVPLNALVIVIILNLTQNARDAQRASLLYSARSIGAGLDAALGKFQALAETLARSPTVLEDDPAAFEVEARRAFAGVEGAWVLLSDLDGHQLVHTALPQGATLPMRHPEGLAGQRRALETRHPVVSDVRVGPVLQSPEFTLDIPVFRNGQPFRAVAVAIKPEALLPLLSGTEIPRNWLVGIMDSQGRYVARIPDHASAVGELASEGWRKTAGREGVFEFASRDGDPIINANDVAALHSWTIGVAVKKSELNTAAWKTIRWSLLSGLFVSMASLALAILLARRIGEDVQSIGANAAALLEGREDHMRVVDVPELADLQRRIAEAAQARHRMESELALRHIELAAVYDSAQVGLCVLDRDLRFVRINRRLAEINGLAPEAHIGRTVHEVVPALAETAVRIRDQVLATGRGVTDVELTGTTDASPGRRRVWLEQWMPLKDASGHIVGLNVAVEEITERKEFEARLALQADRQRRLLDVTHALIARARDERETAEIVFDAIASTLNAEACFNYKVADDRSGLDLVFCRGVSPDDEGKLARLAMGEAFCGTVAEIGTSIAADRTRVMTDPKGAYVAGMGMTAYLCQPLRGANGRVLGTFSVGSRDKTSFTTEDIDFLQTVSNFMAEAWQRIDGTRRLAEREHLLRNVLDGTLAFIGVLDPEGTLREANRPALLAGGLRRGDVVGRKFWDCYWWNWSAEESRRLQEAVARAARGEIVRYDAVVRMKDDARMTIDFMLSPVTDSTGRVILLVPSGFDISERKAAAERQSVLMRELGHRGKNLVSVIQSIASRTLVETRSIKDARTVLFGRLSALANTFGTLTEDGNPAANLRSIIENELNAFGARSEIAGPAVVISGKAAQTLALVVHELATNAAKYGALSVAEGRVTVTWSIDGEPSQRHLNFCWQESGGPAPAVTRGNGFGAALIERVAGAELKCNPELSFAQSGFEYRFTAPLSAFRASSSDGSSDAHGTFSSVHATQRPKEA